MATMAKHKQRSQVSYHENKRNAQHWLMTRPYIPSIGLRHFINLVNDVKKEANDTVQEINEQKGGCGEACLEASRSRITA